MSAEPRPARAAYETARKRELRAARLRARAEDPRYPGVGIWVSLLKLCPHGTESGYNDFGCRCLDMGPPETDDAGQLVLDDAGQPVPTSCRAAGVTAAANRRKRRRQPPDPLPDPARRQPALATLDTPEVMTGGKEPPDRTRTPTRTSRTT